MAYCSKCGAPVAGRFCGTCGADQGDAASQTPPQSPPPQTPPQQPPPQQPQPGPTGSAAPSGLTDNMAGALCYALGALTGILFLVLEPYNRNREIRFHAWQSIFLFCGMFIFYVALSILAVIMPHFLALLIGMAILVVNLGVFLLWLFLMFRTYNGQKTVLPIIGPLAEQRM